MISSYSVVAGVVWLSAALILIALLRKRTGFMLRYSPELLLFVALLALVRTLLPLDLRQAHIIRSFHLMPSVTDAMQSTVLGGITVGQSLLLLWAGGSVVVLLCEICALITDERQRKEFRVIPSRSAGRAAQRAGLSADMIVVTPDVPVPLTAGFIHPKIYFPGISMSMTDDQLDWIVRHELQHMKGRDVWLKLMYYPVLAALWWNPVVWFFAHELDSILEMRCDQAVMRGRTKEEREAYVETLTLVLRQMVGGRRNYPAATVTFARPVKKSVALQRAMLILNAPPRHRAATIAAGCLCVVIFIASYFVLLQPATLPSEYDVVAEIPFAEGDEYYLVHKPDDSYELWYNGSYLGSLYGNYLDEEPFCDMQILEESRGEE